MQQAHTVCRHRGDGVQVEDTLSHKKTYLLDLLLGPGQLKERLGMTGPQAFGSFAEVQCPLAACRMTLESTACACSRIIDLP